MAAIQVVEAIEALQRKFRDDRLTMRLRTYAAIRALILDLQAYNEEAKGTGHGDRRSVLKRAHASCRRYAVEGTDLAWAQVGIALSKLRMVGFEHEDFEGWI